MLLRIEANVKNGKRLLKKSNSSDLKHTRSIMQIHEMKSVGQFLQLICLQKIIIFLDFKNSLAERQINGIVVNI